MYFLQDCREIGRAKYLVSRLVSPFRHQNAADLHYKLLAAASQSAKSYFECKFSRECKEQKLSDKKRIKLNPKIELPRPDLVATVRMSNGDWNASDVFSHCAQTFTTIEFDALFRHFLIPVVHFRYYKGINKRIPVWQKVGFSGKMSCRRGIQRTSFKSRHTNNEENSEVCPSNRLCHLLALNVIPSNTRRRPKRPETRESEIAPCRSRLLFWRTVLGRREQKLRRLVGLEQVEGLETGVAERGAFSISV